MNPRILKLRRVALVVPVLSMLLSAAMARAQDKPFALTTRDTAGGSIIIPSADHPTLLVFVRPDQPQSDHDTRRC